MSQLTSPSLFRTLAGGPEGDFQVFWFSHAGGGTSSLMRAAGSLPGTVELHAAWLPGREDRINEPSYRNLDELVDALAEQLSGRIDRPFALLGHSFGALLGYLLAHRFASEGRPPRLLQVMASLPPTSAREVGEVAEMSDSELAEHLDRNFGAIPAALRDDPESLRYFLPAVRADLEMMESFRYVPGQPLELPVVAIAGIEDRIVTPEQMIGWKSCTNRRFALRSVAGDHFFPVASLPSMIRIATDYLRVGH